jgi:MFS family permease
MAHVSGAIRLDWIRFPPLTQMRCASFTASVDRFSVPPLLVAMSHGLGVTLGDATLAATLYYLLYGVAQLAWAMLADRVGRVAVLRITLAGTMLFGAAAVVAPTFGWLLACRALAGTFAGGITPAAIVYVAETTSFATRGRALDALVGASSLGIATTTAGAGVLAGFDAWRVALALGPICCLLVLAALRVPEPPRPTASITAGLAHLASRPWARFVVVLGLIEGAIVFGSITFFAAAAEHAGASAALAGLTTATFGVATFTFTTVLRHVGGELPHAVRIGAGAALIAVGLAVAAAGAEVGNVFVAALLVGTGYATIHPMLQTWVTDVVPEARGAGVAVFTTMLFGGSSGASFALSGLADEGRFSTLFLLAASAAVPFGLVAGLARRRYRRETA